MRLTDEQLDSLEHSLGMIENDYAPTCRSAPYGNGCPGATDDSLDFWRRAADAVPAMIAELRERRAADEELAVMHREYASLEAHHAAVVAQRNKDWDALMVEIALAVGDADDREAAEMGEIEEFDPWHALRKFRERRAADLTSEDVEALAHAKWELRTFHLGGDRYDKDEHERRCKVVRALAVLDRLIAAHGGAK